DDMLAEFFLHREAGKKSPRFIMTVFVKDRHAPRAQRAGEFPYQERRIAHEGENPSAPGEIVLAFWQVVGHQIELMDFNIGNSRGAAGFLERTDKIGRAFQRNDFAARANDLRQIDCPKTGTGAHIQNTFASGNTDALPAV